MATLNHQYINAEIGLSGGTIYSGSTPLSVIIQNISNGASAAGFSGWTASTGVNSIIANNATGNIGSGVYSFVVGKTTSGTSKYATVLGGRNSGAYGAYSLAFGYNTRAVGAYSIALGISNNTPGIRSVAIGGNQNRTNGTQAGAIAGNINTSRAYNSFIGGGNNNLIYPSAFESSIIGGSGNTISGIWSHISAGKSNIVSGICSAVIVGSGNTVTGKHSGIGAGRNLTNSFDDTWMVQNLTGVSISATTFYSGSTPLSQILQNFSDGNDITRVQPGSNIVTGGTINLPVVGVVGSPNFSGTGTFVSLSATSLSGGTIYSGTTDLGSIINSIGGGSSASLWSASTGTNSIIANNASGNLGSGNFTFIAGKGGKATNAYSCIGGGSANNAYGNFSSVAGGLINTASGTSSNVGGGSQNVANGEFSTIGGGFKNTASNSFGVIFGSGNTVNGALSSIISGAANLISGSNSTIVAGSGNTVSGQRSGIGAGRSLTNVLDDTFMATNFSGISISANTIYSGTTDLSAIINSIGGGGSSTFVQPGSNITTGGSMNFPVVNLVSSPSINGLTASGTALANLFSANTVSGGTFYSGSTELASALGIYNLKHTSFGTTVDGGGDVISTGSKGFKVMPFAGTITKWWLDADVSGSTQFDLKRNGSSIIGAGNKPVLLGVQHTGVTVSSWTSTAIAADDILEFVVDSGTTITRVNLTFYITRT